MAAHAMTRLSTTTALAAVVVLGVAGPALAHVTVAPSSTAAGAVTVLTVTVPHGCEGSPTTAVTISVPAGVTSVMPRPSASWTVGPQSAGPGAEGGTVVTYRAASPLPEGVRGEFELQLRLPDAAGSTLAFPTVQTCESGESAWIEVPAAGQSAADLQLPAPTITVTGEPPGTPAARPSGPASTPAAASPSRAADASSEPSQTSGPGGSGGSGGPGGAAAAMAAGAVGVVAGGGLLVWRRRT